jgi:hypothetical protein
MNIGTYGILIIFGAFVLLLILNPNLSCFGKRLKSPLYPLLRKRTVQKRKPLVTDDYGFNLGGDKSQRKNTAQPQGTPRKKAPAEDFGFDLSDDAKDKDA